MRNDPCIRMSMPNMLTGFQEIIKEISIMQQCDCVNIVKSYGCYFKDSDLWVSECALGYERVCMHVCILVFLGHGKVKLH